MAAGNVSPIAQIPEPLSMPLIAERCGTGRGDLELCGAAKIRGEVLRLPSDERVREQAQGGAAAERRITQAVGDIRGITSNVSGGNTVYRQRRRVGARKVSAIVQRCRPVFIPLVGQRGRSPRNDVKGDTVTRGREPVRRVLNYRRIAASHECPGSADP